jgi:ribonuclease Z
MEDTMRREMKIAFAALLAMGLAQSTETLAQTKAPDDFRVTLLGTGTPIPRPNRFGPSTLVEAGSEKLVFDCGRGCTIRLFQKHIPLRDVKLFITHHHSDHTNGIPDLWLSGWLPPAWAKRETPFMVWGPKGTASMMANLRKAFEEDIQIRKADEKLSEEGISSKATDIAPGVIYDANGVKVTAFEVDHGDEIKPAFGYRIDYKGKSVVISGDTRYNENVLEASRGVDLLIHEVSMARPELLERSEAARRILAHHTTPEEAGKLFNEAKPKLAVFTHFSTAGGSGPDAPKESDYVPAARKVYSGPLEMGEDLMSFVIGETVRVERPNSQ